MILNPKGLCILILICLLFSISAGANDVTLIEANDELEPLQKSLILDIKRYDLSKASDIVYGHGQEARITDLVFMTLKMPKLSNDLKIKVLSLLAMQLPRQENLEPVDLLERVLNNPHHSKKLREKAWDILLVYESEKAYALRRRFKNSTAAEKIPASFDVHFFTAEEVERDLGPHFVEALNLRFQDPDAKERANAIGTLAKNYARIFKNYQENVIPRTLELDELGFDESIAKWANKNTSQKAQNLRAAEGAWREELIHLNKQAHSLIEKALKDSDAAVRKAAATTLLGNSDVALVHLGFEVFSKEENKEVRAALAWSLSSFIDSKGLKDELFKMAKNEIKEEILQKIRKDVEWSLNDFNSKTSLGCAALIKRLF